MKNILKNLILFFLILTCVYLGFWQLDRADQKLSIQTDYQNQLSKEYLDLKEVQKNPLRYTKIMAKGTFLEPYFLLDNIVHNKKAGYLVMSPFLVDDKIIIVNRGWVDNFSRQKFPEILTPESDQQIKGYIKYPMRLLELSGVNMTNEKPFIIQNLNINEISSILKKEMEYGLSLRLELLKLKFLTNDEKLDFNNKITSMVSDYDKFIFY